jgi:hypothetical protein
MKYFHLTQESMMCSLQVEVLKHENKIVVAYSLVQPITEEEKIHYEDLPLEVVRDQVTEVDHHFFDLNIMTHKTQNMSHLVNSRAISSSG